MAQLFFLFPPRQITLGIAKGAWQRNKKEKRTGICLFFARLSRTRVLERFLFICRSSPLCPLADASAYLSTISWGSLRPTGFINPLYRSMVARVAMDDVVNVSPVATFRFFQQLYIILAGAWMFFNTPRPRVDFQIDFFFSNRTKKWFMFWRDDILVKLAHRTINNAATGFCEQSFDYRGS